MYILWLLFLIDLLLNSCFFLHCCSSTRILFRLTGFKTFWFLVIETETPVLHETFFYQILLSFIVIPLDSVIKGYPENKHFSHFLCRCPGLCAVFSLLSYTPASLLLSPQRNWDDPHKFQTKSPFFSAPALPMPPQIFHSLKVQSE